MRRALEKGVFHPVVRYPYGATVTAAGHASLHTGVTPRRHGVVANDRFDGGRGKKRALVDDGEHTVFGTEAFASPTVLRSPTVADALRARHPGAKVASLSVKDRGAILPGGQRPDFVAFYASGIPGFTTSSYYAEALPEWLERWREEHPLTRYLEPWEALAVTAQGVSEPDERSIEALLPGFSRTFPHDPKATPSPSFFIKLTPNSTRYQLDLARATVEALDMGSDLIPDLLLLSVSATDYVGHAFGAESWEFADNLVRTDLMLGAFVRELEKNTTVAVILSSDHGQAPAPTDPVPPRIFPEAMLADLDAALAPTFGEGKYAAGYYIPYVYLTASAAADPRRDQIEREMVRLLTAREDVEGAFLSKQVATWLKDPDPARRVLAEGVDLERSGPIYVVPKKGVIVDPNFRGGGTTHGTPYEFDRDVPVLAFGPRTAAATSQKPQDILQVAASLAALLGIEAPEGANPSPLEGFLAPAR